MIPRWRGSRQVTEVPTSPDILFSNDKDVCTRVFEGPYAAVMTARPSRGQTMTGIPSTFIVETVRIVHAKGGKGIMTVTLNAPATLQLSGATNDPITEPDVEVDWTQLEKKIETHPNYDQVTEGEWLLIQEYFTTSDAARRAAIEALITDAFALQLLEKKKDSVEAFLMFVPVVRRSREYRALPATEDCGVIFSASELSSELQGEPVPEDFVYLKTADRVTRSGRHGNYKRSEEWTGAEQWDTDLYPVPISTE